MLREIRLKNLAIARAVEVHLGEGLNALTGSTGAGKSLVVEAVRWLRGEKTDEGLIRKGEDRASAEAVFDLSARPDLLAALEEMGTEPSQDGILTLRRELRRNGRSAAFVDGGRTSAAHLSRICSRLLQLQSQHQQTELLDPSRHTTLLDDCGVDPELREAWNRCLLAWQQARRQMEEWRRRDEEFQAQREIYEYQRQELESAGLEEGEMDRLRERVALLAGGARLLEAAERARALLEDEEAGALGQIAGAVTQLGGPPEEIGALAESRESLVQAEELVQDAARQIERFLDGAHYDPRQLDADQSRLARLEELCRKYGRNERELIRHLESLQRRMAESQGGGEPPAALRKSLDQATRRLEEAGTALAKARRSVARKVSREATRLLSELGMPEAEMRFEISPRSDPEGPLRFRGARVTPHREGLEEVRILVRANRGERMGPLERAASGGELSRIGLVLRTLAVQRRQPALLILDEVDAGIGADIGLALGRRLLALSEGVQLLVITHLPPVAAMAHRHLVARKDLRGERTVGSIAEVEGEARLEEIRRMLGGEREEARELARALLGHRIRSAGAA